MKFNKFLLILLLLFSFNLFANENIESDKKEERAIEYFDIYDPWEPFNRRVYYFNYQFDKYVFLPALKTYKLITPDPVERGIKNFFINTKNIPTAGNSILQFKISKAMRAIGRFTINVTMGLGGLFDVASSLGMPRPYEDFGLTLAHYGIGKGPYLVLPILGPSNLRDAIGSGVDSLVKGTVYHEADLDFLNHYVTTGVYALNERNNTPFRYYETGSPFEYEYIRFIYQKYRRLQTELGSEVF